MPSTSATLAAPGFDVIESMGPDRVSAADSGARRRTMSVIVCGSAKRPISDDTAMRPGNSESRP